ncbi:helix-turn-helix domain-containing protein [Streptomyces sp. NPDC003860]
MTWLPGPVVAGLWLQALREQTRLSPHDVDTLLRVSAGCVHRIESSTRVPSIAEAVKLAHTYGAYDHSRVTALRTLVTERGPVLHNALPGAWERLAAVWQQAQRVRGVVQYTWPKGLPSLPAHVPAVLLVDDLALGSARDEGPHAARLRALADRATQRQSLEVRVLTHEVRGLPHVEAGAVITLRTGAALSVTLSPDRASLVYRTEPADLEADLDALTRQAALDPVLSVAALRLAADVLEAPLRQGEHHVVPLVLNPATGQVLVTPRAGLLRVPVQPWETVTRAAAEAAHHQWGAAVVATRHLGHHQVEGLGADVVVCSLIGPPPVPACWSAASSVLPEYLVEAALPEITVPPPAPAPSPREEGESDATD